MSLRVLAPAGHFNLCTLQQVKDRLVITGSSEDAKISSLITAASRAIATYLRRELARQRYEEKRPGHGRVRLLLSRYPVDRDSVTVTIDDVANTDFSVENQEAGILYLSSGWWSSRHSPVEDAEETIAATYKAGYVLPDDLSTWTAAATATAGKWIQAPSTNPQPFLFEVTTGGIMAGTEPTWPTTAGTTVTSGAAVLTARDAAALPLDIVEAAILLVASWRSGGAAVAPNVASERLGPQEITYFAGTADRDSALPRAVAALLEPYR